MMSANLENSTDLLGRKLDRDETQILALYRKLRVLCDRDDLPPCALMNLRQALVMVWNACVDLDLIFEEPEVD